MEYSGLIPPYRFIQISGLRGIGVGLEDLFDVIVDLIAGNREPAGPIRGCRIGFRITMGGALKTFIDPRRFIIIAGSIRAIVQ
jgi:hypothetical protein